MLYIRVNAKGKVEQADADTITTKDFYGWLDISETHRVECGIMLNDKPIYVNDIANHKHEYVYVDPMRAAEKPDKYHVASYVIVQDETGEIMLKCLAIPEKHNVSNFVNNDIGKLNKFRFIGNNIEVIGNVNENPELLEVKE